MPVYREQIRPFIELTECEDYLEIGFGDGIHFKSVPVEQKTIISPICHATYPHRAYPMESDLAFELEEFKDEGPFEVAFIDGLHNYPQIVRDLHNVLPYMTTDGVILCHDINPFVMDKNIIELATTYPRPQEAMGWLGDAWKILFHVKYTMPHLDYAVISDFPGFLVLWETESERKIEYKKYGSDDPDYPYKDKTIEFGIKHQNEFYFGTIEEAVKRYEHFFIG